MGTSNDSLLETIDDLSKPKYYVLGIYGDVEPMLSEAFDTKEERDTEALKWKQTDHTDDGGIYRLDIIAGIPICESYGYQELNPEEDESTT